MSLSLSFAEPFYSGASRSLDVPGRFDCALAGRSYMIDTSRMQEFTRRAIPLLRDQADNTGAPGEQTLSPEELWRRSQDDWSHGAGQTYLDREDSDNRRFRSSKGIDVWERWAMSLLPDVGNNRASANTNLHLVPAGDQLYATDGGALLRTTDLVTWTTVSGVPADAATSLTSDGYTVFTAHGASGIYSTTRGAASTASYATGTVDVVGYAKGRLMASSGPSIYNVVAGGALPTALYTHPNSDFDWIGFAGSPSLPVIYAAGFSGDKSLIYRTTIKSDGTGLDVPIVAGELPDGEIVRSIAGYLNFVLLGTDQGIRFCATDDTGNLSIGALIRTGSAVRCFEGQEQYVWFGWTAYDDTSTGLGRLDLTVFPQAGLLAPAYASDLMANGSGAVTSVATFNGKRVFAVSGQGFYDELTTKVASGTLDTGLITYGLPDLKTAVYLDVKVRSAVDTNRAYVSVDGGEFTIVGTRSTTTVDPFTVGELSGETFEVRHELINADADDLVGPVVTRYTLRSYPRPSQGEIFVLPLLLFDVVETHTNAHVQRPDVEFDFLVELRESKRLVTLQLGTSSHTVLVDDAMFQYEKRTGNGSAWNGTAIVKLKSPAT